MTDATDPRDALAGARIRATLDQLAPSPGATARARAAVSAALPARPHRVRTALFATGAAACAAAGLVAIMPRGQTPSATPARPADVLGILATPQIQTPRQMGFRTDVYGFPGIDPASIRPLASRRVGGPEYFVAATRQGFVCLLVKTHGMVPVTECAAPDDLRRGALAVPGGSASVRGGGFGIPVLVADHATVQATGTERLAGDNVWVMPVNARSVVLRRADGSAARIAFPDPVGGWSAVMNAPSTLLLATADHRAAVTVPDLTGLDGADADRVLRAVRLESGAVGTRATDGVAMNGVLAQSPAAGSTAAAETEIATVVATPAGPRRQVAPAAPLDIRFDALPPPVGRHATVADLRGGVTTLVFARTAAQLGAASLGSETQYIGVLPGFLGPRWSRRGSRPIAQIADPDGRLATAAGVASYPTTVVLDNRGRVAATFPGVPDEPRAGTGRVQATVRALGNEPMPDDLRAPEASAGLPLVAGRVPLPADEAPGVWRYRPPAMALWRFGPAADGTTALIATVRTRPGLTAHRVAVKHASQPYWRVGAAPSISAWVVQSRRIGHNDVRVLLVARGYTRCRVAGRDVPVSNGLAVVTTPRGRPGRIELSGPAGTLVLDARGVPIRR